MMLSVPRLSYDCGDIMTEDRQDKECSSDSEPHVRSDQELRSDKQYYARVLAFKSFQWALAYTFTVLVMFALGGPELQSAMAEASEILIWLGVSMYGITGAFVGVNSAFSLKKG